jgi:hypothetical protein
MKRITGFKKRTWVLLGVVAAVAAMATVGAYAYWTTTGAGSGTASVAASNGTIVLHGSAPTQLYPGGSSSVSFTADNAGASNLYVQTIHLVSVDAFAGPGFTNPIPVGTSATDCDTSKFSMPDVPSNTTVLAGASGQAVSGSGTLSYANDPVNNQDGCKSAVLRLNLTSN